MSVDVTDFPEDLGFKFDPTTGEAFMGFTHYDANGEPVTVYEPTDWTWHVDNWIDGPGIKAKAGILAFATRETAEKVAKFLVEHVDSTLKTEISDTFWEAYKVVDSAGNHVPQLQVEAFDGAGNFKAKLNGGLTASTIIRAQNPDFAAEVIKPMLG